MLKPFFRTFVLTACILAGASWSCIISPYFLRGEEIEPGVYRVLRASGWFEVPGTPSVFDTIGVSRVSDFKAWMESVIEENNIVFLAQVDSVIENPSGVPSQLPEPLPTPALVLNSPYSQVPGGEFFLRLTVDTILKGTLPESPFWIKSWYMGTTCGENYRAFKSVRFLNYSDQLDSISDLKLDPWTSMGCNGCPIATTFDGRYFRSPDFPVLRLDITKLYPDYPATGIVTRRYPTIPLRPAGKAYFPDGRTVPEGAGSDRKSPVPVLK